MDIFDIITEALVGQGIWTIFGVGMAIYVLKTSGDRESRLHSIIEKFADKFDIIEDKVDRIETKVDENRKELLENKKG